MNRSRITLLVALAVVALGAIVYLAGCGGKTAGAPPSAKPDQTRIQPAGPSTEAPPEASSPPAATAPSSGEVVLSNGAVTLDAQAVGDGQAHFFTVRLPAGQGLPERKVDFIVLKDGAGIFRTAANACQVCYQEKKGYHQEGTTVVCNNCGNVYPFEKIATEKGGCNPIPINPNLPVTGGTISISKAELEQMAGYF